VLGRKGALSKESLQAIPAPPRKAASGRSSGRSSGRGSARRAEAEDPTESAPTELFTRTEGLAKELLLPPKAHRGLAAAFGRAGASQGGPFSSAPSALPSGPEASSTPSGPLAAEPLPSRIPTEKVRAQRPPPRPYLAWAFAAVAFLSLLLAGYALYRSRAAGPETPQQTLPE
jgi:hypothetical protein